MKKRYDSKEMPEMPMNKGKQIIARCIAILMIGGIVLIGGYSLYKSITEIDKPVPMVSETDSIGRPFEINGYQYYLRNDALYDEKGNMVVQRTRRGQEPLCS